MGLRSWIFALEPIAEESKRTNDFAGSRASLASVRRPVLDGSRWIDPDLRLARLPDCVTKAFGQKRFGYEDPHSR